MSARRVQMYDARQVARNMRETFVDRPVESRIRYNFDWPPMLQNVGDSLAVAYASDKWEPKDRNGERALELYKHLAESRNQCLASRDLLVDYNNRGQAWPVVGPMVSFESGVIMPDHFAMLGLFEEICLQLYTEGTDQEPAFGGSDDDGVVHVKVRHAYLGGGEMRIGTKQRYQRKPFIFVFTRTDGVLFLVVGDELSIEKDGIAG